MKNFKIITFTLILMSQYYALQAGPCIRLAKELSSKQGITESPKRSFATWGTLEVQASKPSYLRSSPAKYFSTSEAKRKSHAFQTSPRESFKPSKEVAALRKRQKQLQKDLVEINKLIREYKEYKKRAKQEKIEPSHEKLFKDKFETAEKEEEIK